MDICTKIPARIPQNMRSLARARARARNLCGRTARFSRNDELIRSNNVRDEIDAESISR